VQAGSAARAFTLQAQIHDESLQPVAPWGGSQGRILVPPRYNSILYVHVCNEEALAQSGSATSECYQGGVKIA